MSMSHHSPEEGEAAKRLIDEIMGVAAKKFPRGNINSEDQGETAYAIAADPWNKLVRIQFSKPMAWLGLTQKQAVQLRNMLDEKIFELEHATTVKE